MKLGASRPAYANHAKRRTTPSARHKRRRQHLLRFVRDKSKKYAKSKIQKCTRITMKMHPSVPSVFPRANCCKICWTFGFIHHAPCPEHMLNMVRFGGEDQIYLTRNNLFAKNDICLARTVDWIFGWSTCNVFFARVVNVFCIFQDFFTFLDFTFLSEGKGRYGIFLLK
jgi:hypothetical protein